MAELLLRILSFIATFAPVAIYSLIVYLSFPKRSVNLTQAPIFFFGGVLCVAVLQPVFYIFPAISDPIERTLVWIVFQMFFQVGLLEEGAKMLIYSQVVRYYEKNNANTHIFMFMSLSCGFAAAENFTYLMSDGPGTVLTRAFTAVVLHMSVGVIAGRYWYEKKRIKGLLLAIFFHGFYDASLAVGYYLGSVKLGILISITSVLVFALYCCRDVLNERLTAIFFTKET